MHWAGEPSCMNGIAFSTHFHFFLTDKEFYLVFKYVYVYICFLTRKSYFQLSARHKKWQPFFSSFFNSAPVPCNVMGNFI